MRQALNYAVPYDTVLDDILQGTGVHISGPVSPNSTYYQDFGFEDLQKYTYDLDTARALLAEAGLADGFEFTLMIPQGNTLVDEIATFLRSEYQKIGVTMNIERATGAVLAEAMGQATGEAYLRGWFTDFVDEPFFHFNLWWRTNSVINWTQYTDPRMDEIVAALKVETDKDAQRDSRPGGNGDHHQRCSRGVDRGWRNTGRPGARSPGLRARAGRVADMGQPLQGGIGAVLPASKL